MKPAKEKPVIYALRLDARVVDCFRKEFSRDRSHQVRTAIDALIANPPGLIGRRKKSTEHPSLVFRCISVPLSREAVAKLHSASRRAQCSSCRFVEVAIAEHLVACLSKRAA